MICVTINLDKVEASDIRTKIASDDPQLIHVITGTYTIDQTFGFQDRCKLLVLAFICIETVQIVSECSTRPIVCIFLKNGYQCKYLFAYFKFELHRTSFKNDETLSKQIYVTNLLINKKVWNL